MFPFDFWREGFNKLWASGVHGQAPARRLAWVGFFFAVLSVLLVTSLGPQGYDLSIGQVAPVTIRAPRTVENRVATERKRKERADLVQPVYDLNPSVATAAQTRIGEVFANLRLVRAEQGLADDKKVETLKSTLHLELLDPVWLSLLKADDTTLAGLEETTRQVVGRALDARIAGEPQAAQIRQQVEDSIRDLGLSSDLRLFVAEVARPLIKANLVYNESETQRARAAVQAQVDPEVVLRDQVIVREGEPVTREQLEILRDLGLLRTGSNARTMGGAAILGFILVGLVGTYVNQNLREMLVSERKIVILGLIFTVTVILSQSLHALSGYLAPVAMATMLVTILLDARLAILVGIAISLFIGIVTNDLRFVMVGLVGGTVGIFSVSRLSQRSDIVRAGLWVGAVNALVIAGLNLARMLGTAWWKEPLWGIANGVFSAILTSGSLPFFENMFGVLTAVKLIEFSNPNQPLLRRLLLEAPGTYHHSLMVANLSEAAAEAVGADALLARVGAYYHDIGKMKRPYFFIDNQFGGENPHDQLSPHLSALIISSHVRDGIEMAREYRLPPEITRFIPEHHGTNLISFFYNRAAQGEKAEQVLEEDFRYDGPRPQSNETAIVMLADAAEAIARSMRHPTAEAVEEAIRKMISARLADGQLNQADLTLRDLDVISSVFVKVLTGIFHSRIEYPDDDLAALEGQKRPNARLRTEPAEKD